ncbi:MAG: type II 3-dehydroquinate dehydratase [Gammaproteobacteria bacterium]|nr:MAG: type II 3-dehydroquinate dehydratase [Gammaproteobacteria bacterium]
MAKILLLNGPNLNLLGTREPEVYGHATLVSIEADLAKTAQAAGHELAAFQSNAEHALIERVHAARTDGTAFILINPGAFLSNVHAREEFRRHSYLADLAVGVIAGFGAGSYRFALDAAIERLSANK